MPSQHNAPICINVLRSVTLLMTQTVHTVWNGYIIISSAGDKLDEMKYVHVNMQQLGVPSSQWSEVTSEPILINCLVCLWQIACWIPPLGSQHCWYVFLGLSKHCTYRHMCMVNTINLIICWHCNVQGADVWVIPLCSVSPHPFNCTRSTLAFDIVDSRHLEIGGWGLTIPWKDTSREMGLGADVVTTLTFEIFCIMWSMEDLSLFISACIHLNLYPHASNHAHAHSMLAMKTCCDDHTIVFIQGHLICAITKTCRKENYWNY